MWSPSTVSVAVTDEPVTIELAQQQARTDGDDEFDDELSRLAVAARAHVERYCGVRFGTQTDTAKCDGFADMARLPEAPVQSITSIQYVDTDGATQTLSTDVYELRAEGIEAAVVLKYGQSWPAIRPGSRITLTAVVGHATVPPTALHAMLLWLSEQFNNHEPAAVAGMTAFDALLVNERRNA